MKALRRGATVLALSIGGILGAGRSVGEETPSPDPLLPFGTFLGGSDSDSAKFLARGPDGALWIVGSSYSLDFPGAPRAAGEENGGDVVVLRFDPVTRTVLSAAWMGSTGYDAPAGIAFDHAGTAYIAGTTGNSATFPVTTGIPNPGDFDSGAFVARVLPDGSGFAWTTVLGGSGWDEATGLAVTPEGDPVVVGRTSSPDFPLKNPFLGVRGGNRDAFVARLRADGTGLVFSSLLGGSDVDDASAAAISPSGGILVAGSTRSPDFPSGEQLLESPSGELGGFLVEIAPDGGSLLRAARLASTDVSGMLVDAEDRLLLLGRTRLEEFPGPQAPHGPPGLDGDAYLLRLDPADWTVLGGTRFGGSEEEYYLSMSLAPDGTVWMSGSTKSVDLPLRAPLRPLLGSSEDTFVATFSEDLALRSSTYMGGNARDLVGGVAAAPDGSAWVAGATGSTDFPVASPLQGRMSDPREYDVFLSRLLPGAAEGAPSRPEGLLAEAQGGSGVCLAWTDASSNETGFAVYRREEEGFARVAFLPADTTAWVDTTVLPDRAYTYAVQAMGASGGSAASAFASAATGPTLDVTVAKGRCRFIPDWFDGYSRMQLEGTLFANGLSADGTIDPCAEGISWVMDRGYDDFSQPLLSIPPDHPDWRVRGRWMRWREGTTRFKFAPDTGRYRLWVREYSWLAFPGETTRMRILVGDDAGSAETTWRGARRYRMRTP